MSNNLKLELADHIHKYLCHEAQYSDLSEAAKESLTAASECIEQAYRLNSHTNNNVSSSSSAAAASSSSSHNSSSPFNITRQHSQPQPHHHHNQTDSARVNYTILPDELLRIFTRHKEYKAGSSTTQAGHHQHHHNKHHHSNQHHHQNDTSVTDGGGGGSSGKHLHPGSHHHSIGVSVHQKNFKQKLIALIKKFRTDGRHFDSEEQYREALERELMKAAAGRGSRAIEELLEEDIDVEAKSGSEQDDWDNVSDSSTPKPSLRPFFSSTTLDQI